MPDSVVSIDSYFSSDDSDDEEYRLAQQEWEESLEQLAQVVSVVLLPFLGRWLGRRWSYWGEFISSQYSHFLTPHLHPTLHHSLCTLRSPRSGEIILSWRRSRSVGIRS